MLDVEVVDLFKRYGSVTALDGVSLGIERGEIFALLGPNGAGKTTLIGCVAGLTRPTRGRALVLGKNVQEHFRETRRAVGLVPQEINFNMFETPLTIVVNQAGFYGIPRPVARASAERCLRQLQLWDKRNAAARTLSGGMKRRLMIARALMHEPRLLILDEPTAGVDIEIRRSMWEFLREINARGTTIILTTHYLEEAESLCRNIAIIDQGAIVERDRMANLLRRLQTETFVLNLRAPLAAAPQLPAFTLTRIDEHTLEAELSKEQNLNALFTELSSRGIEVVSMRNKVNRLEEVFMRLVEARSGALARRA